MSKRTRNIKLQRCTEGRWWNLTGNCYGEWLEILVKPMRFNESLNIRTRYVRKSEYEDANRYNITIPSYYIEKPIEEGVQIPTEIQKLLSKN